MKKETENEKTYSMLINKGKFLKMDVCKTPSSHKFNESYPDRTNEENGLVSAIRSIMDGMLITITGWKENLQQGPLMCFHPVPSYLFPTLSLIHYSTSLEAAEPVHKQLTDM